ncbi:ATP-binding protein [Nocardioides sp.]|uniref:sensor histidine kinase n=1 Tax=Nocardioides sp. TaxID=35761 RepID=UPI003515D918
MSDPLDLLGLMINDSDRRRVLALDHYEVLRRPVDPDLRAIVQLAAQICGTPMATINLITSDAQHQIAAYGFDAAVCAREDSMCAAVMEERGPIVVPDASLDPRFRDNPFVTGVIGRVRFYASHQLSTPGGVVIGTLCVFDEMVRHLDDAQVEALGVLARRIVDVLELALRSRELALSNERLSAFASRLSHDLKSPLATVTLALGILREELEQDLDPDTGLHLLDRALNGSHRMASLIDEVLAYARLGGRLEIAEVDLAAVVREVREDLDEVLAGARVSVGDLPRVRGAEVHLRSVLQNLLDNAAKYAHPARTLEVEVRARRLDRWWRIEVADNGRGVAPADRARIFEPRVRLDDDDRGSGIGLDTVRRVVTAHSGRVGAADSPLGGVTVWFELPA